MFIDVKLAFSTIEVKPYRRKNIKYHRCLPKFHYLFISKHDWFIFCFLQTVDIESIKLFPAGLSHRLKPARCAALAVEKVTAGRLCS